MIEVVGSDTLFQFVPANKEIKRAFYEAAAQRLLFYRGDNQAPSAAVTPEVVEEALARFRTACTTVAGRWPTTEATRETAKTLVTHYLND